MITLRNTPLFTRRGPVQDKRYTFVCEVAMAAEKLRASATPPGGTYCEASYWAGWRDAYAMIGRLIEGSVDNSSVVALSNGLDAYNEWLELRGEVK